MRHTRKRFFYDHFPTVPKKARRRRRARGRKQLYQLEALENRLLLSADALAPLVVDMASSGNELTLRLDPASEKLELVDSRSAVVAARALHATSDVRIRGTNQDDAQGRDGADRLTIDASVPDSLVVHFEAGTGVAAAEEYYRSTAKPVELNQAKAAAV